MNKKLIDKALNYLNIDSNYYDALREHHVLDEEEKLRFLSILGVNDLEKDVEDLEDRKWLTTLEPIYFIRERHSEFRIYFYEHVDFNYENAKFYINKREYNIEYPGKSENYRIIKETIYHKHYFNIPNLDIGYYDLELHIDDNKYTSQLIISPEKCYFPNSLNDEKVKGVACHLYSLYSEHSQGIGDFGDLDILIEKTKKSGGDMILTQPWHYLSIEKDDTNKSPYYPLSRLFLNPLYIDLSQLGMNYDNSFVLNLGSFVEYDNVIDAKIPVLLNYFNSHKKDKEFLKFIKNNKLLSKFACFCALYEKFDRISWKDWDKNYHDPNSEEVKSFELDNKEEILFHQFLQYLADNQLNKSYKLTKELNMRIGLCNDLAVGSGHHSFESWYYGSKIFVQDASIGAPPDDMNKKGQNWGFTPYNPIELRKSAYKPYIDILRVSMEKSGALRLDHAMHIMRLFWNLNEELSNKKVGTYVAMNMDDLLSIIALESHLNKCIVIAEDLGTVADGFREKIKEYNILGTKELYFEIDEKGHYKDTKKYEKISMSTVHTHDTATIRGYLHYHDLNLELYNDMVDEKSFKKSKNARKVMFSDLLKKHDLKYKYELIDVFNNMILESNSCISLIYLDDLTGEKEQLNLPGTTFEHRNWCRKLSQAIEDIEIKF